MDKELCIDVLKDYKEIYEIVLLKKNLLHFCIEIARDSNVSLRMKNKIENFFRHWEILQYIKLSANVDENTKDKFLLGLNNIKVVGLSIGDASILHEYLRKNLKIRVLTQLDTFDEITHGELTRTINEDESDLNKLLKLTDELAENYTTLINKDREIVELYNKFSELQSKLSKYDTTCALDILTDEYSIQDHKISILTFAVEHQTYEEFPHTADAVLKVVNDVEQEINAIRVQISELDSLL